jgi:DNA polymerase
MDIVGIDWETFYDPKQGYSLTTMSTLDYIRDPRFRALGFSLKVNSKPTVYVPESKVAAAMKHLKPQIEASGVYMHNAMFDAAIMNWHYGVRPQMIFDTLSMARARGLQHPDKAGGLSLAKLAAYYGLGEKAWLSPESSAWELEVRAKQDADLTLGVFMRLLPFPKNELELIDWTIRCFTEPKIWADQDMLQELLDERAARLADLFGPGGRTGYNIEDMRSPAMFASVLERFGVEVPMKWSAKQECETWAFAKTDEGMVALLESEDDDVALLAQARLESKAAGDGDRAERLLRAAQHGPVPIPLGYCATHTTRWNGADGLNPQNFKRGGVIRESLRAPNGRLFVVGDSGQVEARGTAWISGQQDLVDLFASGTDVYSAFGTRAFGYAVSKATEYERFSSKTTVLGAGFGASGETLAKQAQAEIRKRNLKLQPPTQETFDALVNSYRQDYAEVPKKWRELETMLATPGYTLGPVVRSETENAIDLPGGLKLYFPNLAYEKYYDKKYNKTRTNWRYDTRKGRTSTWGGKLMENVVSSLCRAILAEQMLRIKKALKEIDGWVVLMVHDEIVSIVPEQHAEEAKVIYNREMRWTPAWAAGLPLACEIGVGHTYGSAKK